MAFYPGFHGHGNSGGIALNFFGGAWILKSLHGPAEIQKQRAPGSDGLVDLWDGLFVKFTSLYNKDNWSPLWKSLLTNQYSEIGSN